MLSATFAECRITYYYAKCRHAECRYAECRYNECRGALEVSLVHSAVFISLHSFVQVVRSTRFQQRHQVLRIYIIYIYICVCVCVCCIYLYGEQERIYHLYFF
jgi:hypothetical protein